MRKGHSTCAALCAGGKIALKRAGRPPLRSAGPVQQESIAVRKQLLLLVIPISRPKVSLTKPTSYAMPVAAHRRSWSTPEAAPQRPIAN